MAACHTTWSSPAKPLILILGATGTGKSNLAIQIAQAFNNTPPNRPLPPSKSYAGAEIINADAMQLYRGLPVITNKVTAAEQCSIPHHLLDHIHLEAEPWTVQSYVREADMVIEEVRRRGNIPIVVGGTGYYVHGLLFKDALLEQRKQDRTQVTEEYEHSEDERAEPDAEYGKDAALTWPILASDTAKIYEKLLEVDPDMAKRWHPNDRRKIQRSLEIYLRSGKKASEFYEEQRRSNSNTATLQGEASGCLTGRSLRYDPIIFWLEAEDKALKDRLNRRVDTMVENGLLSEAQEMDQVSQKARETTAPLDKSKGIWMSIGYKEMEPWLEACRTGSVTEKDLNTIRSTCIEAVKAGTRQYAKRQNRYIRLRLANALAKVKATSNLFLLDCTDLERWQENVLDPALRIVEPFLQGEQLPDPSSLSRLASQIFASMTPEGHVAPRVARKCEMCSKVLMTEAEWTRHLHSRPHKKASEAIRKRELNEVRRQTINLARDIRPVLDEVNSHLATNVQDR